LLITALSVIGATAIALQFVVPRVVRPIESITVAMTGLAAGDTSIDVPGRNRKDEIGRMAEALGVFRDTAIEVQRSNLREIGEGRRRLELAIENISEAFSLYDPRIAWWCAITSTGHSSIRAAPQRWPLA
jgi:HAMP domain-containing protein